MTEDNRDYIIEDYHKNLSFSFEEYTPPVNVYRYGDSFDMSVPYILMEFLPANRNKFRSISDVIGKATPAGQYQLYGFCQVEVMNVYCYSGEFCNEWKLNGRKLTYHLAEVALEYTKRNIEQILSGMYACLDRAETLYAIKDLSYYDENTSSKIYCYSFDVYIRTNVEWDKIPPTYVEEEICEGISEVSVKTQTEDEYNLIT